MNKIAIIAAAAVTTVSFAVGGALAQAGGDFAKADANKDGFVSQEEAMGVYPTLTADLFTKADAMCALLNAVPKFANVRCVGRSSGPLVA